MPVSFHTLKILQVTDKSGFDINLRSDMSSWILCMTQNLSGDSQACIS
jgi:hypothetical protein